MAHWFQFHIATVPFGDRSTLQCTLRSRYIYAVAHDIPSSIEINTFPSDDLERCALLVHGFPFGEEFLDVLDLFEEVFQAGGVALKELWQWG